MKVFLPGNHLNWIIKEQGLRQVGVCFGIDLPSQNIILLRKVVPFKTTQEINNFKNYIKSLWTNTTIKQITKVKPYWL
jgi:hypothetical protein